MSVRLMAQVWNLRLPHEQQSILLALADHAHDDGTKCFPGVDYLAWKTGYDRRSIQRILRAVETSGLAVPVAYLKGGRGHAREYVLRLEKGVIKSPFVRPERAAPGTQRAASETIKGGVGAAPTTSNHQEPYPARARAGGTRSVDRTRGRGLRAIGETLAEAKERRDAEFRALQERRVRERRDLDLTCGCRDPSRCEHSA